MGDIVDVKQKMKMFYFKTKKYGVEFHVMAKSLKEAKEYIKDYCIKIDNNKIRHFNFFQSELNRIIDIKVLKEGEVISTEVC